MCTTYNIEAEYGTFFYNVEESTNGFKEVYDLITPKKTWGFDVRSMGNHFGNDEYEIIPDDAVPVFYVDGVNYFLTNIVKDDRGVIVECKSKIHNTYRFLLLDAAINFLSDEVKVWLDKKEAMFFQEGFTNTTRYQSLKQVLTDCKMI